MWDYKVGHQYLLRAGGMITVLRLHANGSVTAEFNEPQNAGGVNPVNKWDEEGSYIDKWTPHDKDIVEGPF